MKSLRAILPVLLLVSTGRTCAAENGTCDASHAKASSACVTSASASEHSCSSTTSAVTTASLTSTSTKTCTEHGATTSASATRGAAAGARRCSQPYGTACDLGASASATTPGRAVVADDVAPARHVHVVPASITKPVAHPPQPSGEPPAFGPLFLAHQALML